MKWICITLFCMVMGGVPVNCMVDDGKGFTSLSQCLIQI